MNQTTISGTLIFGIIATLTVLGSVIYFDKETYFCEDRKLVMRCDRLSKYYGLENGKCWNNETGNKLCRSGWLLIEDDIDFSENITEPFNIQDCETKFWSESIPIYLNITKEKHVLWNDSCKTLPELINNTLIYVSDYQAQVISSYKKVQRNKTICKDSGKVDVSGKIISYKNSFCRLQGDEIHCDLTKDSSGGGADSNKNGFCDSGEDDCQIIKINEDNSIETLKGSRHKLEAE